MTILIDAKKAFEKIQCLFTIKKKLNNLSIAGMDLNTVKGVCDKPTVSMLLSGERLKDFL